MESVIISQVRELLNTITELLPSLRNPLDEVMNIFYYKTIKNCWWKVSNKGWMIYQHQGQFHLRR